MKLTEQIEQLRGYPTKASEAFRQQLERARMSREQMDGQVAPAKGIDRSGELTPLIRPTIVRTLVDSE
jgi:hypothetical protein